MIDNTTKEQIRTHLNNFCENEGSANKASVALGISGATISKILAGKFDGIADDMWRKLSKVLGYKLDEQWRHADTVPYRAYSELFLDAQQHANVYGVTSHPGSGKTYTLDRYRKSYPNVFYAKCQRHTSERELLTSILRSMGKNSSTRDINAVMANIVSIVERTESPLIIIDELEKVAASTLFCIIDLYNLLEHKCGIVIIGTPNLKHRIDRGLTLGKMCFNELHSRIGGRFIEVPAPTTKDGAAVVRANGIEGNIEIASILNDSHTMDDSSIDLRRVQRLVHKEKITKGVE